LQNSSKPYNQIVNSTSRDLVGEGAIRVNDAKVQISDCKLYNYAVNENVILADYKTADAMGRYVFVYNDGENELHLPYRVYLPSSYDPENNEKYPMLFFLHGHGECGTNNSAQLQVLNKANKLLDDLVNMDNCIILAPQTYCDKANNISEWVASGTGREYRHIWDGSMIHEDKKPGMPIRQGELDDTIYTLGLQAASALLDEFLALDTVDKDRVYVGGISMGGCGTWELIARRPETFAAAVPVCGSGILSTADTLTDIAIWAFHGTSDTTVRPEGSQLMCEAINAAGGNAKYTSFNGIGHSVWDYAYNATNENGQTAAQWLVEQSKAK
jgi:predicted peptidase